MIFESRRGLWLTLFMIAATSPTGCKDSESEPLVVCEKLTKSEFRTFVDHDLVLASGLHEEGFSGADLILGLATSLVLNGIDFGATSETSFSDGRYTLASSDATVGFELYFAEDFEGFAAGEIIPYDVFALETYAVNVEIQIDATQIPPVAVVDYDLGPLFGLVEGDIEVSENLTQATVRLRVRTELIEIAASASQRHTAFWDPEDVFQLEMATTRIDLDALTGDLEGQGVGFSYTGTNYESPNLGLAQRFERAEFLAVRVGDDRYAWDGSYDSTVEKDGMTFYQSGVASNLGGEYTDYFCDSERTQKVGRANHDDSLHGGVFVLEDGTEFEYGFE